MFSTLLTGMSNPKFETKFSTDKQWYWVFKAANGQVLCTSETYTTEQAAKNGIQSLITNIKTHF